MSTGYPQVVANTACERRMWGLKCGLRPTPFVDAVGVAQLAERQLGKRETLGANPAPHPPTSTKGESDLHDPSTAETIALNAIVCHGFLGWRPTRSAEFLTWKRRQSYWNGPYPGFACSVTRGASLRGKSARAGLYSITMSKPSRKWSVAMEGHGGL